MNILEELNRRTKLASELIVLARQIIPQCTNATMANGCVSCMMYNKGLCQSVQEFDVKYISLIEDAKEEKNNENKEKI